MLECIRKNTRFERWLATHVGFFARRWQRRVRAELVGETRRVLEFAQLEVGVQARMYVASLGRPGERERLTKLIGAVLHAENTLLKVIELTAGPETRAAGARTFQEAP